MFFFPKLNSKSHSKFLINILFFIKSEVDFFVQIACPRLSIDWGGYFSKPLLTTYEFFVLMEKTNWNKGYYFNLIHLNDIFS